MGHMDYGRAMLNREWVEEHPLICVYHIPILDGR